MAAKLILCSDDLASDADYLQKKGFLEKKLIKIVKNLEEMDKSTSEEWVFIHHSKETDSFIDELKRHPTFHIAPVFVLKNRLNVYEREDAEMRGLYSISERSDYSEFLKKVEQYNDSALPPHELYELYRSFSDELSEWVSEMRDLQKNFSLEGSQDFFRLLHTIKGTAKTLQFPHLGKFVHYCEDALLVIQSEKIFQQSVSKEIIDGIIKYLSHQAEQIHKNEVLDLPPKALKKKIYTLIDLKKIGWESLLKNSVVKENHSPKEDVKNKENENGLLSKNAMSVRVSNEKLDLLQDHFKKIIQVRSKMSGLVNRLRSEFPDEMFPHDLKSQLEMLGHASSELMEFFISLRITSPERLNTLASKIVSQTSDTLSKKIDFEFFVDKDLEVDSAILNSLDGIISHLIHNSIDHGIEKFGKIILKIQKTNNDLISITLSDNGKGIDQDRLKEKLIETGMMTRERVNQLASEHLIEFIFLDGLSTKTEVTELSGRGVGMSAVKEEIIKCGGEIKVKSSPNEGTTFLITLPRIFRL